jgi:hypothetical protein
MKSEELNKLRCPDVHFNRTSQVRADIEITLHTVVRAKSRGSGTILFLPVRTSYHGNLKYHTLQNIWTNFINRSEYSNNIQQRCYTKAALFTATQRIYYEVQCFFLCMTENSHNMVNDMASCIGLLLLE